MGQLLSAAVLVFLLLGAVWMDRPKELMDRAPRVERPNHGDEFSALSDEARLIPKSAPWAGTFSSGSGLTGTNIYILSSGRYCLNEWGDTGWMWSSCGRVRDQGDRLASESKAAWEASEKDGPTYLKVRWGRRRYLVPVRNVLAFVNAVNSGSMPGGESVYSYGSFLREGDDALPVEGLPELPEPYRRFLRAQPVSAKVTETGFRKGRLFWVASKVLLPIETPCRIDVTLDGGSAAGLFVGMELHSRDTEERLKATVTSLQPDSAEARIDYYNCRKRNPHIGEVFATR